MSSEDAGFRCGDYIQHILEAARLARTFTEGMAKADFLADKRTQQAVILNLITIGEAATRISNEYKDFVASHPAIPWQQMRGMRNRMAHGYFDINLDVVWDTPRSKARPTTRFVPSRPWASSSSPPNAEEPGLEGKRRAKGAAKARRVLTAV